MDIMLLVHTQQNEQSKDEIQAGLLYTAKNVSPVIDLMFKSEIVIFLFF